MSDKKWYSKNEIIDITDISINTLNLWIAKDKATTNDVKTIKKAKYFSLNYVKNIFIKHDRLDLVSLFIEKDAKEHGGLIEKGSNTLPDNDINAVIEAKNRHISSLEKEIKSKDEGLKAKNEQITKLQTILENQQILSKDLQSKISSQNLILENQEITKKRKKFLGIF